MPKTPLESVAHAAIEKAASELEQLARNLRNDLYAADPRADVRDTLVDFATVLDIVSDLHVYLHEVGDLTPDGVQACEAAQ